MSRSPRGNPNELARLAIEKNCPELAADQLKYDEVLSALTELASAFGRRKFALFYNLREPDDVTEDLSRLHYQGKISFDEFKSKLRADVDRPIDSAMLRQIYRGYLRRVRHYSAALQIIGQIAHEQRDPDSWLRLEPIVDRHVKAIEKKLPAYSEQLKKTFEFVAKARTRRRLGVVALKEFHGRSVLWLTQLVLNYMTQSWSSSKDIAKRSRTRPEYLYATTASSLFFRTAYDSLPQPQQLTEHLVTEYRAMARELTRSQRLRERGRLIDPATIDEFSKAKEIERADVSLIVKEAVASLHEVEELEPFIRNIIGDETHTPHGPTEIADIFTFVRLDGRKASAAFVLKGRSFKKVTSRDVSSQFDKVRPLPNLDLFVFLATGNIQDDARRDFLQTSKDIGCTHTIIDVVDCARILIAYRKICPHDGKPLDTLGRCVDGHKSTY